MSQLAVLMFEHADQARHLARDRDGQAVHARTAENCRSPCVSEFGPPLLVDTGLVLRKHPVA